MMPASLTNHWTYHPLHQDQIITIDPRAKVARQISWTKPSDKTRPTPWSFPEPDNYNRAVYAPKPIDCLSLKEIVWFRYKKGWITLACVDIKEFNFDLWIMRNAAYWAMWRHKHMQPRPQETLLGTKTRVNRKELTDNEILFHQGFYERLKLRVEDPAIVDQRVGTPCEQYHRFVEDLTTLDRFSNLDFTE